MTIGVSINFRSCLDYYGMYLTNVEMVQPEVQTTYINIPGRTGALDLTEALAGGVRYYNGSITMTFQTAYDICGRSWIEQLEFVSNELHGYNAQIVFDGSETIYYGRCEVSGTPTAGGIYEIVVTVNTAFF